jgi:hypothetical protein
MLQQVQRIGVQVVDWRVQDALEPLILNTVRTQPVRHM